MNSTTLSLVAGNYGRGRGEECWVTSEIYSSASVIGKESSSSLSSCLFRGASSSIRVYNGSLRVTAKVKKWKKHDYPWPEDLDTNIKSGFLSHLSHFKPLAEKPKPVTLPFEKPLMDLEKRIIEVRRMADETGLDFSDQIGALENKYQQALKDLYTHLTPIQRLTIARHPNRPTVLDHILNITEKWVELHGDRAGYDDPAIVTGIGTIDGKSYMFIGHQKGRNTKENITRNFAMPTPHGYRKALRMMKYADHHGFPIVTFVDTPGAFADLKSEELGQGEAIAQNLRTMFGLKVPIVTVVTGEGGSGGALAIACANKLFMLENSAFYVASPEACAAILWKSSQAAPKAAEKLRITAQEHYRLKIADAIIPEPLGGAHADPVWTSQQIKLTITQAVQELTNMNTEELLRHRMLKYRHIGGFQEGMPVEPERKRHMKPSEVNRPDTDEIEIELQNLKKQILESKTPSDPVSNEAIQKLKQDMDQEITSAFISMGLHGELESIKLELSKTDRPPDHPLNRNLKEKVDRILQEFNNNLSRPGAYLGLKQKLERQHTVSRLVDIKERSEKLKVEINQKVPEEVKAKIETLMRAEEMLSKGDSVDMNLLEEVENCKKELIEALKSAGLEIVGIAKRNAASPPPAVQEKIMKVNKEVAREIERAISSAGLDGKVEELKSKILKGAGSEEVEKMETEIKERILAAMDDVTLKEKFENMGPELESPSEVTEDKVAAENGRW